MGQSARIYHPALFFDPSWGIASVGIVDSRGRPFLIILENGKPPRQKDTADAFNSGDVNPAPVKYPPLANRWDPEDLTQFLQDPATGWDFLGFRSVLTLIRDELEHYVDFLEPAHATLVACWIMATYFYPLFPAFPRLAIHGERGSGKSKLLGLIADMAFNGLLRIAPTPANLFRLIEPLRPTLCLDEMEGLNGPGQRELKAILNSGYKDGGAVERVEEYQGKRVTVSYSVYAPIAIGSISEPDATFRDRAIVVRMLRSGDGEKVNRSPWPNSRKVQVIRAACYRLALTRWREVREMFEKGNYPPGLIGRQRELYRPLVAMALLADGEPVPSRSDAARDLAHMEVVQEIFGQVFRENGPPEPGVEEVEDMVLSRLPEPEAEPGPFENANEVMWVATDELGDRESLPDDGRALFEVLSERLQLSDRITVYPKELEPAVRGALDLPPDPRGPWDHPTSADIGHLLKRYKFERGKRKERGIPYTVSRETFIDRARRYGFPVPEFPAVGSCRVL
jgi:hypothetical protein